MQLVSYSVRHLTSQCHVKDVWVWKLFYVQAEHLQKRIYIHKINSILTHVWVLCQKVYVLHNKKCTPYLVVNYVENLCTYLVLFLDYIFEPNYVLFGAVNFTVCGLPSKGDRILAAQEISFHKFQFYGSLHHIAINENTNLMQQSFKCLFHRNRPLYMCRVLHPPIIRSFKHVQSGVV